MMKMKRTLALLLAATMTASLCACGKDESSVEVQSDVVTMPQAEQTIEDSLKIPDDATKTLRWMAHYDINPAVGSDRSVALALFEDVAGGKIEYMQTTWDTRMEDLAASIIGGNAPDIFPYEPIAFPSHIVQERYQPIDPVVDFSDPLWSDMKEAADVYMINGEHYLAPISFSQAVIMTYNKKAIDENGLDDPYELYLNGEWDWDAFYNIMTEYMEGDDPDNPTRHGLNGWWQPHFMMTTGQTTINMEGNKFVNNLHNADLERAAEYIYNITKNGLYYDTWIGSANAALEQQGCLFFAMGEWAHVGASGPSEDSEWGIVPMPQDPNSDKNYTSSSLFTYMWVKGSTANEAMKSWLACERIAATDENYLETTKQKFFVDNPYWTDEMYQVKMDLNSPTAFTQVADLGYGVSDQLNSTVIPAIYESCSKFEGEQQITWAQTREKYGPVIDTEIAYVNTELEKMLG